jgi:hypothetical protein
MTSQNKEFKGRAQFAIGIGIGNWAEVVDN